jgi:hypothetical protein
MDPKDSVLCRDRGPDDLAAPTVAETRYLLKIAASTDWVAGVVGWVDLAAPDAAR